MNNADRLRADLTSLGWSQSRLALWLSEQTGDLITTRYVERWLAPRGYRCPGWPSALLRLAGLTG